MRKAVFQITFPDGDDLPAELFEFGLFLGVAGDVAVKFGLPEGGVVFGKRGGAFGAAVPEASVNEDGELFGDVGDVGAAGDLFVVEAISAEACGPESLAQFEFRAGVFGPVRAHHARDRFALGNGRSFVTNVHVNSDDK